MQLVRTADLILYAKDRIKYYDNAILENKKAHDQKIQEHKNTVWYRLFRSPYCESCEEFSWTHWHYKDKRHGFIELLAKAEYNEKLQYMFTEYDRSDFFMWAKANNIPF